MHGFDRRHDAPDQVEQASFFGNAAEHPGVAMAGEDVLEDRVAPVGDGCDFDDVAQALRAVVAGEFSEGPFDFLSIGQHMPFDHHLGVGRHHEIIAESFGRHRGGWAPPMMAPTSA